MFQYLVSDTPVRCDEENEMTTAEGHGRPTATFCQQTPTEFGNHFGTTTKLPISCSKIQVIAKEIKFQEHRNGGRPIEMKPHSTPATLLWLDKNYELAEGICIPRNTLYSHYIHFCKSNCMSPLNSASFGKIIRQAFPSLTTRRLGTRGQSRYHYYGIAVRDSSPYYDIAFSKMSFSCEGKKPQEKNGSGLALGKSKDVVKLWPQFPNMKEISFPAHVPQEKVTSFIFMYHTHCQRIFDTIVRGAMNDAYQFLEHFWQGVPSHLSDLLNTNTVVNMVGVCDSILYRTINSVLMPSVLKSCSESLIQMIRTFADRLENWITSALCDVPANLKSLKLKLGKRFCATLRRQIVLYQLTHTAQVVFSNGEMMSHIHKDWKKINLGPIVRQTLLFTESSNDCHQTVDHIKTYWETFQELIQRQAPIEDYTEKLENLVHGCVVETSNRKQTPLRNFARPFVLLWHVLGSLISRDMTIHSAASFGSFHLIQIMFDEYVHYLVEMLSSEDMTNHLLRNVALDVSPDVSSNWGGFGDEVDVLASRGNLSGIESGMEVIQGDFESDGVSLYGSGAEFNLSKVSEPRNECSFVDNPCEYQNGRKEEPERKYSSSDSFSESIQMAGFNSCDQECVEFSADIYCQENLHYNAQNMQYQSNSYCEGNSFECLE